MIPRPLADKIISITPPVSPFARLATLPFPSAPPRADGGDEELADLGWIHALPAAPQSRPVMPRAPQPPPHGLLEAPTARLGLASVAVGRETGGPSGGSSLPPRRSDPFLDEHAGTPRHRALAVQLAAATGPVAARASYAPGRRITALALHEPPPVAAAALATACDTVAVGAADGSIAIWPLTAPTPAARFVAFRPFSRGAAVPVTALAFAPDGLTLVAGGGDGGIRNACYRPRRLTVAGQAAGAALPWAARPAIGLAVNSAGGTDALLDHGAAASWPAGDARCLIVTPRSALGTTRFTLFAHDGTRPVYASATHVHLGSDADTIAFAARPGAAVTLTALAARDDAVLTGASDGSLALHLVGAGKRPVCLWQVQAHATAITAVALSSHLACSGASDGTAAAWSAEPDGRAVRLAELEGDGTAVREMRATSGHIVIATGARVGVW